MNFKCQEYAIQDLKKLAEGNKHSIIISGPAGIGKSYISKMMTEFLNIRDIQYIAPVVSDIRDTIVECIQLNNPVIIVIENLDLGVITASYTLLKFLEEPNDNVYIVVTCRDLMKIPDTILSRCSTISIPPPTDNDIICYSESKNSDKFYKLKVLPIWKAIKNFSDVDTLFRLSKLEIEYIQDLVQNLDFLQPISSTVWNLSHFKDGKDCPVQLVLQFFASIVQDVHMFKFVIDCIHDLQVGRVGIQTILSKFVLNCKYYIKKV